MHGSELSALGNLRNQCTQWKYSLLLPIFSQAEHNPFEESDLYFVLWRCCMAKIADLHAHCVAHLRPLVSLLFGGFQDLHHRTTEHKSGILRFWMVDLIHSQKVGCVIPSLQPPYVDNLSVTDGLKEHIPTNIGDTGLLFCDQANKKKVCWRRPEEEAAVSPSSPQTGEYD